MSLRRKLLMTFGALALMALAVAGTTLWVVAQWRITHDGLQDHYQRSLLLQRVRVAVFRAFKEVPDAAAFGEAKARREFDRLIESAGEDFRRWSALAHTQEERDQVRRVRAAYDELVRDARAVFDLVDAGRRDEAVRLTRGALESARYRRFLERTEEAVASDQRYREEIRARNRQTRQTAQLVLAISIFGTISLALLLAAYLASDLFAPLREVERALREAARGDLRHRLDEERDDEFGAVHRAFNRLVESIGRRDAPAEALRPERTDVRALLYEVLPRFHDELVRGAVDVELAVAPDVGPALLDRLRIREAVIELARDALATLPGRGGRLGVRASIDPEGSLLIEVAADGAGDGGAWPGPGPELARSAVELHGGDLVIDIVPGQGPYARITLPPREG